MIRRSGEKLSNNSLKPAAYQLVPLIKLLLNGFNALLISDGVGVGKTISAGYIISYFSTFGQPSLIVAPPMLVDKWILELRNKFNIKSIPIRSVEEFSTAVSEIKLESQSVYIMSSSILLNRKLKILVEKLGLIVFDEIHNYRNPETISYQKALTLSKQATYRIGLSATPINNSLKDLITEMSILLPNLEFSLIDAIIKDNWERNNNLITIPLTTRFTKERLGIHFAKRIITHHSISYPSIYINKVKDKIENLPQNERNSVFEKITYYRMATSSPAAISKALDLDFSLRQDPKFEEFKKILMTSQSPHMLVFCEFEDTAKYISENLDNVESYLVSGAIPLFDRQAKINAFRRTDKGVLIMTPVGTEGIDLQFCSSLCNYDLHWNPMKIEQRIGRIDRIGQEKKEIYIHNFIVEGSIDANVITKLTNKLNIIANSIFKINEIISSNDSNVTLLANEEILEKEIVEGDTLAATLKFNQEILEKDYDLAKLIKNELCQPFTIRQAGMEKMTYRQFIEEDPKSSDIVDYYLKKTHELDQLIKLYE